MTESAFRRSLLRLALVPILSLLVFVAILGVELRKIVILRIAGAQATTILLQSYRVQKSLLDEETGVRGYLAGESPLFLQPYNDAVAQFHNEFGTLQRFASSSPALSVNIAHLTSSSKQFEDANQRLLKGTPWTESNIDPLTQQKQAMDSLRAGLASIVEEQTRVRESNRDALTRILARLPAILIGFGSLIALLLLWYGNALFKKIASAFQQQLQATTLQRDSLETTLQSIGDAVIVCDSAGKITMMNPTAVKATGWMLAQAKGEQLERVFRIINEDTRETVESPVAKVFRVGTVVGLANHTLLVRRDGTEIPIDDSGAPIRDREGEIAGVVLVFRDITDRKQAEEALRESSATRLRLAAIIDTADDAIISKNLNGIVTSWNDGAEKMFGYSAGEMVGKPILSIIPEELISEEGEILQSIRAGKRINHFETKRRKMNGEVLEVSVTISPIRDEAGVIIGASTIAREITDRKRVERLLVQSEKLAATGRMAATIAHEINNPLESLMNLIFLARQDSAPGENVHEYLITAEEELERLSHLARQTLGFYRDTGSPTEVYVHQLMENVIGVYRSKLRAAGISIDTQFHDQRKVLILRGEFLQVFSNVITNAADVMRQGGALSISTRETDGPWGDGIETVIRDTGSGIRPEHLEQIFEPFFTTKGELGTGIGLWVAKQLVESRGGTISVASSIEDGESGTTVTITIPFASPAGK